MRTQRVGCASRAAATIEMAVEQQRKVLAAIASAPDAGRARDAVLEIVGADTPAARGTVERQVIPWLHFFVKHDPRPVLGRVRCPVLALNGSLDLQVISTQNLPAIEAAVRAGGNTDVTAKELPGLNHLFQPATTGMVDEYQKVTTTFDPDVLALLTAWLHERLDR